MYRCASAKTTGCAASLAGFSNDLMRPIVTLGFGANDWLLVCLLGRGRLAGWLASSTVGT